MWQRGFGGSHDAIGRLVVLNGVSFTVAGVMPRGFNGTLQVGQPYDVIVPLASYRAVTRGDNPDDPNYWWILMMGRLKGGATADRLQLAGDTILKQTVASVKPDLKATALPRLKVESGARGQTEIRNGLREPIQIMAVVVGIVLLVACANVANLLLARGSARARELAVRSAIGAPRRRIVRQLLTEGLLLGLIACAGGLLLAQWMTSALVPALAVNAEVLSTRFELDARILGFTCGLAVLCSIVFALLPAIRSSEARMTTGLQENSRGAVGGRRRFSAAGTLVVVQVALSVLLLSVAGLLAWSAWRLQQVDPGFDASNLLTFSVDTSLNGYEGERSSAFFADALERLRGIPGVTAASLSSHRLIANSSAILVARPAGTPAPLPDTPEAQEFNRRHLAWRLATDDGFLQTMKIPLLRGRALTPADSAQAPKVAIVNVALAKQLFGTADAVGRRFVAGLRPGNPEIEIVGVSADARYTSMRRDPPPTLYVPYQQDALSRVTFEVRTAGATHRDRAAGPRHTAPARCDPSDLRHPDAAGTDRSFARTGASLRAACGAAGRRDARALGDRSLRTAGLCGDAPHTRDRRPDGSWRRARPGAVDGDATVSAAGGYRVGPRDPGCCAVVESGGVSPLRLEPSRSGGIHRRVDGDGHREPRRRVRPRSPGVPDRSAHSAAR